MNRLNYEMTERKIKNLDLAKFIDKSERSIGNYRDGITQPPVDVAEKITEFLSVNYQVEIPVTELFKDVELVEQANP